MIDTLEGWREIGCDPPTWERRNASDELIARVWQRSDRYWQYESCYGALGAVPTREEAIETCDSDIARTQAASN